jgi:lysophospholipase L1-like esterase
MIMVTNDSTQRQMNKIHLTEYGHPHSQIGLDSTLSEDVAVEVDEEEIDEQQKLLLTRVNQRRERCIRFSQGILALLGILCIPVILLFHALKNDTNYHTMHNDDNKRNHDLTFHVPKVYTLPNSTVDIVENVEMTPWLSYILERDNVTTYRCYTQTDAVAESSLPPCPCASPLTPQARTTRKWHTVVQRNRREVEAALAAQMAYENDSASKSATTVNPYWDVIFLGDSITEHWVGTDLGELEPEWEDNVRVFQELFNKSHGAPLQGLALGIGGDRTGHLLERIMREELAEPDGSPTPLNPAFWWLLIGTNDSSDSCNADAILMGNIFIVELLLQRYPDSTIVINSLLPRGSQPMDTNFGNELFSPVNHQLEEYAANHTRVLFFNATDLFLAPHNDSRLYVNETRLGDLLHPNGEGSQCWGEAIVDQIESWRTTGVVPNHPAAPP